MNNTTASMPKIYTLSLILLAFFLVNTTSYGADEPVKQLQAFLKSSKSLTADFKQVLFMVTTLCQFMFDEYGLTDQIVNENSQIRNVNQDLRFNDHVTRT